MQINLTQTIILLIFISFYNSVKLVSGECSSRQFSCASGQCVPFTWRCDGHSDCHDGSDEQSCEVRTCSATEFPCSNGDCIPSRWQCDNENDCGDMSDENVAFCSNRTCRPDQFACVGNKGVCIPKTWQCDNQKDCLDGSDEIGDCAHLTCTADEFACNNNKCITKRWVCDHDDDCGDNSDEVNPDFTCPNVTCSSSEYTCDNGKCIPLRWLCDGENDCPDHSDEHPSKCATKKPEPSKCTDKEFMCKVGLDCIPEAWQCDGDSDCPDGSDEQNCNNTCRPDQFQCHNLHCIPSSLHCNGQKECLDDSDEFNCSVSVPKKCDPHTQFDCGDNNCIDIANVCNGNNDCGNWKDEPEGQCDINECTTNNGGCMHICVDTRDGFYCKCNDGFKLVGNSSCDDIDECQIPGSCSQTCINTRGSYKCECIEGYQLDPHDHHYCKATGGQAKLLFANRHDIRLIDLETKEYTSVASDLKTAVALDFSFSKQLVVWSDIYQEHICSVNMNAGPKAGINNIISKDVITPDGISVDWIYEHIYWTDTGKNTIEIANFDGSMRKVLFSNNGVEEPRAIAVNPVDGWLYWTDWGSSAKIERAGMDGTNRRVIIDTRISWPNGLTIDFVSKRIYWVDAKLKLISSSDYNGDNRRVILSENPQVLHPFSVSVFEDWIYWTDWENEDIFRANKFTGKNIEVIARNVFSAMDIHVFHKYRQPAGQNHCGSNNGHCSHFCLPAPQLRSESAKYTCACPDNMVLMTNGQTCEVKTLPVNTTTTTAITTSTTTTTTTTADYTSSSDMPHSDVTVETTPEVTVETTHHSFSSNEVQRHNESFSEHHSGGPKQLNSTGHIAGIVIGVVGGLAVLIGLILFIVYRQYLRRNITSMNFDNPVYRKTTEDQFSLEKNQYQPSRTYPPTMEPLTSPGTNEFV